MAACGEEDVVSLSQVVAEDRELEETANAVLGDSDDSNCTYTKVESVSRAQTVRASGAWRTWDIARESGGRERGEGRKGRRHGGSE